jgi:hypothetical protein
MTRLKEPSSIADSQCCAPKELPEALRGRRAALVIAHPGHELRVYQWLRLARPTVFILTDGSGRTDKSRIQRTTRILQECGADLGELYGRMTDAELYTAIINRDSRCFIELAAEIADCLRTEEIDYVVGDAVEGYNPAHDLCRYVTNAAITSLARAGRGLGNYDVAIASANGRSGNDHTRLAIELGVNMLAEKIRVVQSYVELDADIQRILNTEGMTPLRTEELCCITRMSFDSSPEPPYYEQYGRQQIALGHYRELITYRDHVRPIAEALRTFAEGGNLATCA